MNATYCNFYFQNVSFICRITNSLLIYPLICQSTTASSQKSINIQGHVGLFMATDPPILSPSPYIVFLFEKPLSMKRQQHKWIPRIGFNGILSSIMFGFVYVYVISMNSSSEAIITFVGSHSDQIVNAEGNIEKVGNVCLLWNMDVCEGWKYSWLTGLY